MYKLLIALKMICVALILIFTLISCGGDKAQKETPIRPVKHMKVSLHDSNDQHSFNGTAQANDEANLSFRVAGTVSKIRVKVGDKVRSGQVLAEVDPADYAVQLKQVEAQERGALASEKSAETSIKSSEANYIAAKSSYQRITKLYENNSVSLSQFEQAKSQYEAALAQYEASKAQHEAAQFSSAASSEQRQSAKNQVAYTYLRAPFTGIISLQHVEENELVNSGTPVLTISSLGHPQVVVGVPEVLISKINKNISSSIHFSTLPDKSFVGKVAEIGYSPGSGSTYPVTLDLLENDLDIRPGMQAKVTFVLEPGSNTKSIVIPASAIGEDAKGNFVFGLEKSESENIVITTKRYIEIGNLTNAGFEVYKGLNEGDLIAVAGLNILLEGDKVRL